MKPYDDPKEIVPAIYEPVTVAEAKLATRTNGSTEDGLFAIYIEAARRNLEKATGRTFFQKTLEWSLDYWNDYATVRAIWGSGGSSGLGWMGNYIELPRATPLLGITSVKYTDFNGNETAFDQANYIVDTDSMPGRLVLGYNKTWPSFTPLAANAIKIRYTAGTAYVYPTSLAGDIRSATLLLVGTMYANRESEIPVDNLAKQLLKLPLFRNMVESLRVVHQYSDQ